MPALEDVSLNPIGFLETNRSNLNHQIGPRWLPPTRELQFEDGKIFTPFYPSWHALTADASRGSTTILTSETLGSGVIVPCENGNPTSCKMQFPTTNPPDKVKPGLIGLEEERLGKEIEVSHGMSYQSSIPFQGDRRLTLRLFHTEKFSRVNYPRNILKDLDSSTIDEYPINPRTSEKFF